jgi:hypothetical protein
MKTIIQTCVTNSLVFLGVLFAGFTALAPEAFGVMPPPDGGYPNKNTAEGQDALFSLTNRTANTANGFSALKANRTGDRNTANGALALFTNVIGSENIAEDVAKVNPVLVVRDKEGKPHSVRYDQVNAMLLNEFLKEHHKVQELEKQIENLTAALQKVSDRLEPSTAPPQVVNNP